MATDIKCPSCGHQFEPNEAIREEVEKELRSKAADWQKKKNDEFQLKLEEEKKNIRQSLEENIRKNISADFENKLKLAEQNNKDNEEKLKLSRAKELEFLKKENELKAKEEELELSLQKKLNEERSKLSVEIRQLEEQKNAAKETDYQLKVKDLEEKLESQKKLAEEMRRKAEQGSMQSQGESQELLLEELLRTTFPFDVISEVGKGVRGADCIQTVRNNLGQECGKIIFESKRTKDFANDWIEKIKADMRSQGAEVAVIVTQALPKDFDRFGEKEGVWICSFAEVKPVVQMLRNGIIKLSTALKSQDNKGDKMHLLYDYLTSREFAEQWQAIREGFMSMRNSIQKERDAMERLWKAREKQLDKVVLSAAHVRGSIEGISGTDVDLNLIEDSTDSDE
ncbi:MAG: DUF2130 domain-containing protein [Chitinophagaceae bacterium]|nr:DUF2130 domain-containing protein [Chitinophagaceae bacterium]MBP7108391.1 DUF2130 domain-containing protein [Chitinophagaceae bacterium]MBP7314131.1 DUF2130 domain-containing protein [Chitinophagaceae bacterium]HQZ49785.1 DUF2130 domain-containing protein [Chitinophagaceae bacterium]